MMKNGLDERQNQEMARIGMYSFYVMFVVSAAVIVAELIWKGTFEVVVGEMAVFLAGGIIYLAGCMRKGIWTKSGKDLTAWQSALMSMAFFVKVSILGFLCLVVMGRISRMRRERQEKKYLE